MLTRRSFITRAAGTTAAAGLAAAYLGSGPAFASPLGQSAQAGLRTFIDGALVDQAAVVEWEKRRFSVVAARLRQDYVGVLTGELDSLLARLENAVDDVSAARVALALARLSIGEAGIRELLAAELVASESAARAGIAASDGRWQYAITEVSSDRGTAQGFLDWFDRARVTDDRPVWTDACPDHYLIATLPDGRQEVIEVTGGAMLPSQFFVDYTDVAGVMVPSDPAYPLTAAGVASLADGFVIGGVRHQFRDEPGGGFRAQLKVAFPAALPGLYIAEHRWHLACEFGNWITAYLRTV
ncbi:twin-arginine translocation signal domain-containing protein [Nocardia sp. NPDC004415]